MERSAIKKERISMGQWLPITEDKKFLLAESEVISLSFGFCRSNVADEARSSKSSTYAKAMGVHTEVQDRCDWWL